MHSRPTTQRLIDNTPSCSALGSQLLHRNTGSPAFAGPTRNVTGEAMPTSFDVALTQLSFLEFVQRCNVLAAPSQSTQLPASVSLVDVAVQTAAPCEVSQDSSTQTSDQPGPSLSLDVAVQTIFRSVCSSSLDAAVQTLSHTSLPRTFLRSLALAQCPRFQWMRHCRLLHIVWCNLMLPHNSTSRSSRLDFLRQSSGSSTSSLSVPAISAGLTCGTPAPTWT